MTQPDGKITQLEVREIARALTLANPKVRARLRKECESGAITPAIFIALLNYGYGVPKQKIEVDPGRGLMNFLTRMPLGYDPLNPDKPNVKVITARYGEAGMAALKAGTEARGETVETDGGSASKENTLAVPAMSSIVPRPDLVAQAKGGAQAPEKRAARTCKPEPDDGAIPLRIDGV